MAKMTVSGLIPAPEAGILPLTASIHMVKRE